MKSLDKKNTQIVDNKTAEHSECNEPTESLFANLKKDLLAKKYPSENNVSKNYVGVRFKQYDTEDVSHEVIEQDKYRLLIHWNNEIGLANSYCSIELFEYNLFDGTFTIVPESEVLPERPFVGLMPCKDLASAIHQHCFDYKNMETVVDGETIEHRIWDCYNTLFYVIKKWVEADEKDFIDYVKKSKPCLVGRECEWTDTVLPVHKSIDENGDLLPKENSDISPLDNAATPKSYSEDEVIKILDTFNRSTLKLQEYKLGNSYNVKDWWEDFKQQTK